MSDHRCMLQIYDAIRSAETIAISGHINPDGDCIGSALGLGTICESMGKTVYHLMNEPVPQHLSYIPGIDRFVTASDAISRCARFDLFIMVDLGDRLRLGESAQVMDAAERTICIDHHKTSTGICELNLIDASASSTCELIAELAFDMRMPVNAMAATVLYAGIITDSNRFLYENARAKTLRLAADLLDHGADADRIYLEEYQMIDANLLAFQGEVIRTMERFNGGRVVMANITSELLTRYGLKMSDVESIVSVMRDIRGVEIACIVKDRGEGEQKVSFRSKCDIDVAELAQRFGGGGHVKASGCTLTMSNADAYKMIRHALGALRWPE